MTLYIEKVLLLLFLIILLINSPVISFREGPLFFEDKGWAISPPPTPVKEKHFCTTVTVEENRVIHEEKNRISEVLSTIPSHVSSRV